MTHADVLVGAFARREEKATFQDGTPIPHIPWRWNGEETMTPEERAKACWKDMPYDDNGKVYDAASYIADAIRASVAEEREACAKVAACIGEHGDCGDSSSPPACCAFAEAANQITAAIRARATP